jgi:ABC-type hemin transport system substrate-binding protein
LKRLDIEKTSVEGVVGSVRWVAAGLEVDEKAEQIAKTFGVDLELIS